MNNSCIKCILLNNSFVISVAPAFLQPYSSVIKRFDPNIIFEYGGIGLWLVYDHKECYLSQAVGQQPILYCEQYALALIPELIEELQIKNHKRVFVFTDNQTTFENLLKTPKQLAYPNFLNKMKLNMSENFIIIVSCISTS